MKLKEAMMSKKKRTITGHTQGQVKAQEKLSKTLKTGKSLKDRNKALAEVLKGS